MMITPYNSHIDHVEELSGEEIRAEICELSKEWRDLAETRGRAAEDPDKALMYKRAFLVNQATRSRSKKISSFDYQFSVAICYGVDLNIRSFAILKLSKLPLTAPKKRQPHLQPNRETTYIRLIYLSKDPNNLFGELGYKKVGVRVVEYVLNKCREGFAGVFVEPVPEARPFFAHLGFEPISEAASGSQKGMIWKPPRQSPSSPLCEEIRPQDAHNHT